MAYTGQTIENPVSGERITFLQTARDTAGELLEFELELSPDGHVPGAHVHPEQEERFHVLEGTMKFRLGDAPDRRRGRRDRRRPGRQRPPVR
jgi:quercetin dioxygenase-like cupin family protein